jgi:ADP-ribose pyrophosphatase YjhB (NUDIX family)
VRPVAFFAHCPRCGAPAPEAPGSGPFRCAPCGFVLFFNAASAVAVILLRDDGRALFIRRAKEPGKGRLGLPGGFVDDGESAEGALRREVREEVGLEVEHLVYLSSHPNLYPYRSVTYATLDLFFTATTEQPDRARALDGVERIEWIDPLAVALDEIAFESMRDALRVYRTRGPHGSV